MIQIRPYTAPHSLREGMLAYAEPAEPTRIVPLASLAAPAPSPGASTTKTRAAADDDVVFIDVDADDPATATTSTGGGPSDDGDTPGTLLPGAKRMPTRQGGQSTVYMTDDRVLKISDGDIDDDAPEINARLKRIDPQRKRYMWSDKLGPMKGKNQHFHIMPRLKPYPADHKFTAAQKAHLRQSVDELFRNSVLGHGDLKADNVMHSGDLDKPVLVAQTNNNNLQLRRSKDAKP